MAMQHGPSPHSVIILQLSLVQFIYPSQTAAQMQESCDMWCFAEAALDTLLSIVGSPRSQPAHFPLLFAVP